MRGLLILGGVGILSAAASIITAGTGAWAQDQGQARVHGPGGRGGTHSSGFTGPMKHATHHPANFGLAFQPEMRELFAGQPEPGPPAPDMPLGDLGVGGPGHLMVGHQLVPSIHSLTHVPMRFDGDEVANRPPVAPIADDSDRAGAATAQPDPNASPLPPRPPGAAGPGRRVSGWSSPGLAGPGRPASPRK